MVAVAQRGAIVSGIRAGRTNSQIAAFNSIPISTVKKISKLYHDFLASGEKDEDFDINAHRTQDWCRANLPHFWEKEVWPPSSPDVNPLDFFVWGVAERDTNRSPHNTKDSLIRSIKDVFTNFHREDVVHACSRVRSRLEEIIAANGDFIR